MITRIAFVVLAVTLLLTSCKTPHEPCAPREFEIVPLPTTFGVQRDARLVGRVTIAPDQSATFEPDPNADPARVAEFKAWFDAAIAEDGASYEFSDAAPDGTHYSCGGRVAKGKPEYPAALKAAIYSDYYEVVDAP